MSTESSQTKKAKLQNEMSDNEYFQWLSTANYSISDTDNVEQIIIRFKSLFEDIVSDESNCTFLMDIMAMDANKQNLFLSYLKKQGFVKIQTIKSKHYAIITQNPLQNYQKMTPYHRFILIHSQKDSNLYGFRNNQFIIKENIILTNQIIKSA